MKALTTTDQTECAMIMDALDIWEQCKPSHGHDTCDGILPMNGMDGDVWLVITNARGHLTIHALQECSQAEAFAYLDQVRGDVAFCNPRVQFYGEEYQHAQAFN
ncbi:MAG TPA: hypothetical protein VMQ76_07245 [Terracidiphilus sp.]|nr:hypothetical protein [Terracidiphilus sp.]